MAQASSKYCSRRTGEERDSFGGSSQPWESQRWKSSELVDLMMIYIIWTSKNHGDLLVDLCIESLEYIRIIKTHQDTTDIGDSIWFNQQTNGIFMSFKHERRWLGQVSQVSHPTFKTNTQLLEPFQVPLNDLRFIVGQFLAGWWLSPTPLKNMTSSVGMMIIPNWMEQQN